MFSGQFNNDLPNLKDAVTFSISAENPNGEKGKGAQSIPKENNPASDLGKGWKVSPCSIIKKHSTLTLCDIKSSGIIQHIWVTFDEKFLNFLVLRVYYNDNKNPSIQLPLASFFCNGNGKISKLASSMILVNSKGGMNSYWPIPFEKGCKIEVENAYEEDVTAFFYQISGNLGSLTIPPIYLHTFYNRKRSSPSCPEHVLIEDVKNSGIYAGTYLAWSQLSTGWWGEGEMKFYIDGDKEYPTICGTGVEDYFGGAWSFGEGTYSTAFLGYPEKSDTNDVKKHGLYRFHIMDPIYFRKDLRVTVQTLGWWPDWKKFKGLDDDIASTSYVYLNNTQTFIERKFPLSELYPR